MDEKIKFRFRAFLLWLVLEPWTEKFSFPNLRTIFFVLMLVFSTLRKPTLFLISFIAEIILYGIYEYRSGKYIHWYRQRRKERLKKMEKTNYEILEGAKAIREIYAPLVEGAFDEEITADSEEEVRKIQEEKKNRQIYK